MTGKLDALDDDQQRDKKQKRKARKERRALKQAREKRRERAAIKAENRRKREEEKEAARAKAEAALAEIPPPIKLPAVEQPGNQFRRLRFWINWQMILAFFVILLPTALFAVYQGFIATPRYIAETKFTIRSISFSPAPDIAQSLLSGVSSETTEMAQQVMTYVKSPDMLRELEANEKIAFRQTLESQQVDFWTRQEVDASLEERVDNFQSFIEIEFEEQSAILTLRVRGFTPQQAYDTLVLVREESRDLVQRISRQLAEHQVEFMEEEAEKKRRDVGALRERIVRLQNTLNLIDPNSETAAAVARISGIEQQLTTERINLDNMLRTMSPNSNQVQEIKGRIASLEKELRAQRATLTGADQEALNQINEDFRTATFEATLAEQAYALTLQSLESSRVEASRGLKVLATVVEPYLPQEALEPRVVFNIFTFFAFSLIAYMVSIIMVMVAREHVD
ncbi:MAG: hypothetical protein Alpg2KO_06320 [Alphaproteobacteria bacterium]